MNAPARPPAAAPIRARSKRGRVLRDWDFGLGRGHLTEVVEAKGGKWVRREGKSERVVEIEISWGFGEGRPREEETLASIGE